MSSKENKMRLFAQGIRDGFPIGLGYLAVSFSLGIAAKQIGITPFQGFLASLTTVASAGQYAGWTVIAAQAPYFEMVLTILVANARYLLMSFALSQRISPKTSLLNRIGVGYGLTDEIFGVSIAREGYLQPVHSYGMFLSSIPLWSIGTALGIIMGNVLPFRVVSALSVSLYAMFIAIIVPPARKDKVIAVLVIISFIASYLVSRLPVFSQISEGTKIIILTVVIAGIASAVKPIREEEDE